MEAKRPPKPLIITSLCKLNTKSCLNQITISWTPADIQHTVSIYLGEKNRFYVHESFCCGPDPGLTMRGRIFRKKSVLFEWHFKKVKKHIRYVLDFFAEIPRATFQDKISFIFLFCPGYRSFCHFCVSCKFLLVFRSFISEKLSNLVFWSKNEFLWQIFACVCCVIVERICTLTQGDSVSTLCQCCHRNNVPVFKNDIQLTRSHAKMGSVYTESIRKWMFVTLSHRENAISLLCVIAEMTFPLDWVNPEWF